MSPKKTFASLIEDAGHKTDELIRLPINSDPARTAIITSFMKDLREADRQIRWEVMQIARAPVFSEISLYVRKVRDFLYNLPVSDVDVGGTGPIGQANQVVQQLAFHEQLAIDHYAAEEARKPQPTKSRRADLAELRDSGQAVLGSVVAFIQLAQDSLARELGAGPSR